MSVKMSFSPSESKKGGKGGNIHGREKRVRLLFPLFPAHLSGYVVRRISLSTLRLSPPPAAAICMGRHTVKAPHKRQWRPLALSLHAKTLSRKTSSCMGNMPKSPKRFFPPPFQPPLPFVANSRDSPLPSFLHCLFWLDRLRTMRFPLSLESMDGWTPTHPHHTPPFPLRM